MPVDSHLSWNEIRDFTGGLWETDAELMPANAAQTMTDCYPVKTGGLRAWFKPATFTTTGIDSPSTETPFALAVHEGVINRSGNGISNDYYLITCAADTTIKVYRMDGTNGETTWTRVKTHDAGLVPSNVLETATYKLTDGTLYLTYALGASAGTGANGGGLWSLQYSNGAFVHLHNFQNFHVNNYQSRLITTKNLGGTIYFTSPGVITDINSNTAPVDLSEGIPSISGMATFSPGDLMVFKSGAPIYLVEGDLTNYTVRQMNGSHLRGQYPSRIETGIAFISVGDGIYQTPDGSQLMPMSKQLKASSIDGPMLFQAHYLWTGKKGYILDTDTGAWFRTSFVTATGGNTPAVKMVLQPGILFADPISTFTLGLLTINDGLTSGRAESYTWKSAPLRDTNGRQTEIRAVQVYARSTNGATSTITVTINGVGQTLACDSSGRGGLTFYFMARKEELDITVTAASNASGVEAPMIEAVRFAGQPGHFLRPTADVG